MREGMFHQAASASFTEISLDVDADRDGIVEKNNPNKVCISVFTRAERMTLYSSEIHF